MIESKLQAGDRVCGFIVKKVTEVSDVRSLAIELEHEKSGAKMLHVYNDDAENLFAAAFRTPPQDDTGLPHILEHTVLCGSKKYPVKDPFVELLKTSLATFLNAMTYPDKTVYPCASMNEKDFFNLAGVYCDAVFHPIISEMHFKQEGHHYDFAESGNTNSPLITKGIVYNEMKGAYSDLDGTIEREEAKLLFPENAYGRDSGGDPEAIPTLTYADFKKFHEIYYHPSNAYIFSYGNIPTEKQLEFLDKEYLSAYDKIEIDTSITEQPRWSEPRSATIPYPAGENDEVDKKSAVVVAWMTNQLTDPITSFAMNLLDSYLLSNAASPLRKALVDSKLGEELTNSGYADYQRDTFFTVGLKGTSPDKCEDIIKLIKEVCAKEAEQGLDKNKLEAAFHQLEMAALEIQPQYPLRVMNRVLRTWIYDVEPLEHLKLQENITKLRKQYETEPAFFEKLIKEQIVENSHQMTYVFTPDAKFNERQLLAQEEKMTQVKANMDKKQLADIAQEAQELNAMQQSENSPEAIATLPKLAISDVNPDPLEFAYEECKVNGRPFIKCNEFCSDLNYLSIGFNVSDFDSELLTYLPIFTQVLTKMGVGDLDYAAAAEKEAACCSGVNASVDAFGRIDDFNTPNPVVLLTVKGLQRKLPQMLEAIKTRIFEVDLSDKDRLFDILTQARVQHRASIIYNGNSYATSYAASSLSASSSLKEKFSGVSLVRLYDELVDNFNPEKLLGIFTRIKNELINSQRLSACAAGKGIGEIENWYSSIITEMESRELTSAQITSNPNKIQIIGLATPADVAFVARAMPGVTGVSKHAPALSLLGMNLSFGYLWNEVRAKRGAYGCRASSNTLAGYFSFASYRDPFINETLATYDKVSDYVMQDMDLSANAVEQAIIGTIKTIDVPWRPAQIISAAHSRFLAGSNYQFRQDYRKRLLSVTGDSIKEAVEEVLLKGMQNAPICIISSKEKLQQAANSGLVVNIEEL